MTEPAYLSISDAARHLGVSRDTVRDWIKAGKLPVYEFGPRTVRVKIEELEAVGRAPKAVDVRAIARRSLR